jgi:hypothetical protein
LHLLLLQVLFANSQTKFFEHYASSYADLANQGYKKQEIVTLNSEIVTPNSSSRRSRVEAGN